MLPVSNILLDCVNPANSVRTTLPGCKAHVDRHDYVRKTDPKCGNFAKKNKKMHPGKWKLLVQLHVCNDINDSSSTTRTYMPRAASQPAPTARLPKPEIISHSPRGSLTNQTRDFRGGGEENETPAYKTRSNQTLRCKS